MCVYIYIYIYVYIYIYISIYIYIYTLGCPLGVSGNSSPKLGSRLNNKQFRHLKS